MKKIIGLIAAVAMMLSVNVCALDCSLTNESDGPVGILTAPDGMKYEIKGRVVNAPSPLAVQDSEKSITYAYDVTIPRSSGSLEGNQQVDPSVSLIAYVTVYWEEITKGVFTGVLLTDTSVRWTTSDSPVAPRLLGAVTR